MPDASTAPALGPLPSWNLDDLYPGPESEELREALAEAARRAKDFRARWQGKVAGLDGDALGEAVAEFEQLDELMGRIASYAQLLHAGDMTDAAVAQFYQTTVERVTDASAQLVFFTIEINAIPDERLDGMTEAARLARYAPWLREVRAMRPHQLSDELERYAYEKSVAGRSAWNRLFDETMARLRFVIDGREMNSTEALERLSDPDRARRAAAGAALAKVFRANLPLFSLVTNTLAKDKEIDDRWRNFARPVSSRNLANRVEDEVVDALVAAVREAYLDLSHRYYRLKAGWLGLDRLEHYDRNAPLPDVPERVFTWEEARETVLGAYGRFAPDMAEVAGRFFERRWIDAPVRPGKAPGAFSHPTVPGAHPYVLVNYLGKPRDVMTLAHELGHGVHQVLAAGQGGLLADTPLTLAETASVFGEMLTFRALLAREEDPARRRALIAAKVEDMLNTVVRQIAFFEFERRVHDARREGEISAETLCDIWIEVQTESLGPAFRFDEDYRTYWCYVPHFVHSPFYVYAYAFGDCLVNSLYALYEQGHPDFREKYFAMLRAGGSKRHGELLAPFGLDATDPAFWAKGLGVIRGFIDELERVE